MTQYRNSNGQISIDRDEAEADRALILEAIKALNQAISYLDTNKLDDGRFRGIARSELDNQLQMIRQHINQITGDSGSGCEHVRVIIAAAIKKYEDIDRALQIAAQGVR